MDKETRCIIILEAEKCTKIEHKETKLNFHILWTVHPNISIVFFQQLDTQILYFNTFIIFFYKFRALLCSSSGGQIVLVQHLVSSPSLGDCSVRRLQSSSKLCTEQSPKDSDDTRCCTNTICPPEDEHSRARNL